MSKIGSCVPLAALVAVAALVLVVAAAVLEGVDDVAAAAGAGAD